MLQICHLEFFNNKKNMLFFTTKYKLKISNPLPVNVVTQVCVHQALHYALAGYKI